jgi:Zn-dependent protease with chaperone function
MDEDDTKGQFVGLLLCVFLVPAVGWLVGTNLAIGQERRTVQELAYLAFGLGLALLMLILIMPLVAGTNRKRMALIFGPMVRLVMLLLAASVLVQAGLFVYSLFTLEATILNRVHGGILLAIGFGALVVSLVLLRAALSMLKLEPAHVRATLLTAAEAPGLFERVGQLADTLGADKPDNIIVGLEPNFYVTAAPIRLIGQDVTLNGKTLFASLSLMRILSKTEFDAVIGHELGHFRGEDVTYSMKFAPTYARLGKTLESLAHSTESAADLGKLPATVALSLCLSRFATSERTVGRERELLADQAGARVASPQALATALLKVFLFSSNWDWLSENHVEALGQGRTYVQLSRTFREVSELSPDADWDNIMNSLTWVVQAHPVDTHPPFAERLENLKILPSDLKPEHCRAGSDTPTELIPGVDEIDAQLTQLEAQWLVAIGAAAPPSQAADA